jgi:hypothetical protein
MNLNGDEKRIRQLFSDLSRDDQRRTPHFASVLAGDQSEVPRTRRRIPSFRFAVAAAMLCIAMLIVMFAVLRSSKQKGPVPDDQVSVTTSPEPQPKDREPVTGVESKDTKPRIVRFNRARHRRTAPSLAAAMKSLSSWQSPTASLLQTPADELLKSLPRLGESLKTIKRFSPDQFN